MAIQKTISDLKEGPKEDKVAVASGIAVTVVVVLLAGWAIFFLRSIANGSQNLQLGGSAQDQFNFTSVTQAQQQLQQIYGSSTQQNDLIQIRNESAQQNAQVQQQTQMQQIQGSGTDQFGSPNSGN